jgi:hypothetical protein
VGGPTMLINFHKRPNKTMMEVQWWIHKWRCPK